MLRHTCPLQPEEERSLILVIPVSLSHLLSLALCLAWSVFLTVFAAGQHVSLCMSWLRDLVLFFQRTISGNPSVKWKRWCRSFKVEMYNGVFVLSLSVSFSLSPLTHFSGQASCLWNHYCYTHFLTFRLHFLFVGSCSESAHCRFVRLNPFHVLMYVRCVCCYHSSWQVGQKGVISNILLLCH